MNAPTFCFVCTKPTASRNAICPSCGFDPVAPACPRCHRPVTDAVSWSNGISRFPWHLRLDHDPACSACGHPLSARIERATGHRRSGSGEPGDRIDARSTISIDPSASCRVDPLDAAHYVPTIRIGVERAVGDDDDDEGGGLGRHARIELSVDECAALIDRLQGSLHVLMMRTPWFVDRT
jgi:hypothetical protein